MKSAIAFLILGTAGTVSADSWVSAEVPTAVAVSDMQEQTFRAGAMPAVGGYLTLSDHVAIGLRVRAGVLRNGAAPGGNLMDPSTGGLATAGFAGRVIFGHTYFELVAGGGITGDDVVPAFEAGAGYMFDFERFSVGPSARFARLQASASDAFGSADLVLVGVDVQFGHAHHRVVMPRIVHTEPPPAPVVEVPAPVTPDDDRIVDTVPSCADLLEFLDAGSGCGPGADIDVQGDRIILDDRVLFDTDHAHVHAEGRAAIRGIVKAAEHHPEWLMITIEGHTDVRGGDAYNQALSEARAARTRDVMIKAGMPEDRVKIVGYGRTHPRDPGTTPEAHHHNRRVEFVIDRAAHKASADGATP
jgi:outer membrane protein OmpA-like peptidoglycan-associated protein